MELHSFIKIKISDSWGKEKEEDLEKEQTTNTCSQFDDFVKNILSHKSWKFYEISKNLHKLPFRCNYANEFWQNIVYSYKLQLNSKWVALIFSQIL